MSRENFNDLLVFLAVAREKSFTRAAVKLGSSQSALSHTMRTLEARLGVRLLDRTTRSVSLTEAGQRLFDSVGPRFDDIESDLAAVIELGEKPAGTIRITAIDHIIDTVLWPRLRPVLATNPDLHIELSADYRLVDIAAERFDIGVRYGDQVELDMIAVRLSPDIPTAIVGAPSYFALRPVPATPQDLLKHNCIGLRLAGGGRYAWELADGERKVQARVTGQAMFTGAYQMLHAAIDGAGLAFLTMDLVQDALADGRLVQVMPDWCPPFPGIHAYYSSRRHPTRAFTTVMDALRAGAADQARSISQSASLPLR
ncbi:MAG: LysR family transcriptional regulator [Massilia sp.]